MKFNRSFICSSFVVCLALYLVSGVSMVFAKNQIVLLQPDISEGSANSLSDQQMQEPHIQRVGNVVFAATELLQTSAVDENSSTMVGTQTADGLEGGELLVSFFSDTNFVVTIEKERYPQSNVLSVRGRQKEKPFSTFTMTVTEDAYIISFQDVNSGLLYKVVGDGKSGKGKVTEIDPSKLPPVFDSEPIVPPQ